LYASTPLFNWSRASACRTRSWKSPGRPRQPRAPKYVRLHSCSYPSPSGKRLIVATWNLLVQLTAGGGTAARMKNEPLFSTRINCLQAGLAIAALSGYPNPIQTPPASRNSTANRRQLLLLAGDNLRRHQPDVIHVRCMANINHLGHIAKSILSSPLTNMTRSARLA